MGLHSRKPEEEAERERKEKEKDSLAFKNNFVARRRAGGLCESGLYVFCVREKVFLESSVVLIVHGSIMRKPLSLIIPF
jgi:hypothetical protein